MLSPTRHGKGVQHSSDPKMDFLNVPQFCSNISINSMKIICKYVMMIYHLFSKQSTIIKSWKTNQIKHNKDDNLYSYIRVNPFKTQNMREIAQNVPQFDNFKKCSSGPRILGHHHKSVWPTGRTSGCPADLTLLTLSKKPIPDMIRHIEQSRGRIYWTIV